MLLHYWVYVIKIQDFLLSEIKDDTKKLVKNCLQELQLL